MLSTTLLHALAFLPQSGQGPSTAPVVINEFNYDDSSSDTEEFVEIYNRSTSPVDLSNWSLVGDDSNGVNFTEVFPAGTILNPGDYLVVGDATVPNVDIVRASGFLQNSNESITLFDDSQNIIDTLIYEANKGVFNAALAEGEGIWGNVTMVDGQNLTWARIRDGYDSDDNGNDFRLMPWTPGASNNLPFVPQIVEVFDGQLVGDDATGWRGSFVNPRVIDPAIVDGNNPSAIPASPQGGNAVVSWDPSGGGNFAMPLAAGGKNVRFEAYVYIESAVTPTTELEGWSVGFGASGTFYNFPDPTGTLAFDANGNTGVSWTLIRDEFGANIYFIDHNNGGIGGNALTVPTTIGSVAITPGVDDGWQRLLIEITGGNVTARFGGTYGVADGTVFTTTVDDIERGLYTGYREGLGTNSDARPLTMDLVTVEIQASAFTQPYGTGCDNLNLSVTGAPTIGNNNFSLEVNNVGTVPLAFVSFGTAAVNPGADLTPVGMAGCFGYTNNAIGLYQTSGVVGGTGSFPLPIPNAAIFIGSTFSAQGVAFSPATSLGLVSSNGMLLFFGL